MMADLTPKDLANRLLFNLNRHLAIREVAARLLARDQKGRDFFPRGVSPSTVQGDTLEDLCAAYLQVSSRKMMGGN